MKKPTFYNGIIILDFSKLTFRLGKEMDFSAFSCILIKYQPFKGYFKFFIDFPTFCKFDIDVLISNRNCVTSIKIKRKGAKNSLKPKYDLTH